MKDSIFYLVTCAIIALTAVSITKAEYIDTQSFNKTSLIIENNRSLFKMKVGDQNVIVAEESAEVLPAGFSILAGNSKDERWVSYVTCPDLSMKNATLVILELPAGLERKHTFSGKAFYPAPPAWSIDGRLTFVLIDSFSENSELCVISAETGNMECCRNLPDLRPYIFTGICPENLGWFDDFIVYRDYRAHREYLVTLNDCEVDVGPLYHIPESVREARFFVGKSKSLPCSVPARSQQDSNWKDIPLNGCPGQTIGSAGCALVSVAMVFQYYGGSYEPDDLNSCLGEHACEMDWPYAAAHCKGGATVNWIGRYDSANWSVIDTMLANGHPPIATSGGHFYVVTGGSGQNPNNYTINDPWDGTTYKKMSAYGFIGIRRYSGTPDCGTSCCICP